MHRGFAQRREQPAVDHGKFVDDHKRIGFRQLSQPLRRPSGRGAAGDPLVRIQFFKQRGQRPYDGCLARSRAAGQDHRVLFKKRVDRVQLRLIVGDRQLFLQRVQLKLQRFGIDRFQFFKRKQRQKLRDLDLRVILIDMIDPPFFFH